MLQGSCDIVVREPMQTTILEMKHPVGVWVLSCAALLLLVPKAAAQRGLSGQQYDTMPFQQPNLYPAGIGPGGRLEFAGSEARPKILLTGYWPLSNHMLRAFNADPAQNSTGWVGSNWEGRGYDVYAYFAEFAGGGGQGSGDLQVDYQDTSEDFWRIADELKPIAVITFSRGFANKKWELEWNNRNLAVWMDDFTPPAAAHSCSSRWIGPGRTHQELDSAAPEDRGRRERGYSSEHRHRDRLRRQWGGVSVRVHRLSRGLVPGGAC